MNQAGPAPDDAIALNALGMRALAEDDFEQARDLFARATRADAKAGQLWINLAAAERSLASVEGERFALSRALAIDQRDLIALIRLAELHERQNEIGDATRRWSDVCAMIRSLPKTNPALQALLTHASDFVAARSMELSQSVDAAMSAASTGTDPGQRRRVDAAIDVMFGRRRVYANVCSGVHVPFLPADEFFDRAAFPWLDQIEAATADIREELSALIASGYGFEPYVDMPSGTPENIWSPLNGSLNWGSLHLWRHGKPDEAAGARCPRTAAALAALPLAQVSGRMPTAFFSLLRPRTNIPPHTGVSNVRAIIHLPLIVPPGCRFRVGGDTREWREGQALIFDDTIEHEAWNDSDELRAVLIFDTWNPHLSDDERAMLKTFFAAADRDRTAPLGAAITD